MYGGGFLHFQSHAVQRIMLENLSAIIKHASVKKERLYRKNGINPEGSFDSPVCARPHQLDSLTDDL